MPTAPQPALSAPSSASRFSIASQPSWPMPGPRGAWTAAWRTRLSLLQLPGCRGLQDGEGQPLPSILQAESQSQWGGGLGAVGNRMGWKSAGPCCLGLKSMAVFLGSDPGLLKARAFPRVQVSEELLDQAQITLGAHPRAFQGLWDVARASGDAQSWDQSFELVASAKPTRLARLLLARGLSFPICPEHQTCGSQY